MPKKRFSTQYAKPQSTVHPSLSSSSNPSNQNNAPPSVNELISSLRKTQISVSSPGPSTTVTPTLPPHLRQLLSQPETPPPPPRVRDRRRVDANGRRLPAGPAAPRSWALAGSRWAPSTSALRARGDKRLFPAEVEHLPGLPTDGTDGGQRRLDNSCMRVMARNWEFVREYEKNYLADLPTKLRILLLSNIAVYGPEEGIGFEGLESLLILPTTDGGVTVEKDRNEGFYRLDLSGSVGRSVSFKQLTALLRKPEQPAEDLEDEVSWEDESISRCLSPPIPHLTHLSLSHPPSTISWPRFLAFTKHIPTLTHLSLAYWPVPSLTPNAKTTVMASSIRGDIQYGGTNFYSHSLDNDFREASLVLHRLAKSLYSLEYLDLSGCADWIRALRWTSDDDGSGGSLDWSSQWAKLLALRILSGINLYEDSEFPEVVRYIAAVEEAFAMEDMLAYHAKKAVRVGRQVKWIEVEKDDWTVYKTLWKEMGDGAKKKMDAIITLDRNYPPWRAANIQANEEVPRVSQVINTAWED
ncbi:hypothetical protein LOCC1_G003897 [Lachnellula occidentalis]|uniref:Tafazzin n=1 Tax=Lachnellula occidentalis TaxID=215460 RepID=A0A8H8S7J6_9HELO|nr:hypothetical protein LOCC1_G003897 [Lachnellula occidentalis]